MQNKEHSDISNTSPPLPDDERRERIRELVRERRRRSATYWENPQAWAELHRELKKLARN